MSDKKDKQCAYTVEYCQGVDVPDTRGREKTEDYYRVRELDLEREYIIPATTGYPPSEKGESLEDYLDRIKKHPKLQGCTYIPWDELNHRFRLL